MRDYPSTPRSTRSQTYRSRVAPYAPRNRRSAAIPRRLQQPRLNATVDRNYDRVVDAIGDDAYATARDQYFDNNSRAFTSARFGSREFDRFLQNQRSYAQGARERAVRPYLDDYISGRRRPENEAEVRSRVVNNIFQNLGARRVLNLADDEEVEFVVEPEAGYAAREVLRDQPDIRIMRRYPNADPYNLEPGSFARAA